METFFEILGLTTPMRRFLLTLFLGLGVEYYLKPSTSFESSPKTEGGGGTGIPIFSLKKWSVLIGDQPNSTYLPFGSIPLVLAIVFATFW